MRRLFLLLAVIMFLVSVGFAQWSSWASASNNSDIEYRWWASTPSGSEECHFQVRDLHLKNLTKLELLIDYKYGNVESIPVSFVISNNPGEKLIGQCVSIMAIHVRDLKRD